MIHLRAQAEEVKRILDGYLTGAETSTPKRKEKDQNFNTLPLIILLDWYLIVITLLWQP